MEKEDEMRRKRKKERRKVGEETGRPKTNICQIKGVGVQE
jgi:hypothetical protein